MATGKLRDEVDELFKLPLAEFTAARNTLAAQLKQRGLANDANLVKTLAKPSVSAWTVNQLYWKHREAFDRLLAAGQRFRKAQTSGLAGKVADMRGSLDARREALLHLSDLATSLLQDAGHNPGPDTIRRVTTTLEAISALADGPAPGRLTQDVDPPGFESLASFVPGAAAAALKAQPKATADRDEGRREETRQARIAAAKASLQTAKKSLADARSRAQSLEASQKKAYAEAKQAEKQLREAEERFKKATVASDAAAQRSQSVAAGAAEATKEVEDARRTLDKASKELESLFGEQSK